MTVTLAVECTDRSTDGPRFPSSSFAPARPGDRDIIAAVRRTPACDILFLRRTATYTACIIIIRYHVFNNENRVKDRRDRRRLSQRSLPYCPAAEERRDVERIVRVLSAVRVQPTLTL